MKLTGILCCLMVLLSTLCSACFHNTQDKSPAECLIGKGDKSGPGYIAIDRHGRTSFIFGDTGITFRGVAWINYAKPWNDVLDIRYDHVNDTHGVLSTVSLEDNEPESVIMGTIDQGCWLNLKKFLGDVKAPVKITED